MRPQQPPPTLTQIETIERLNVACGTSWPVPKTEREARFLIDGLVSEERKLKRGTGENHGDY